MATSLGVNLYNLEHTSGEEVLFGQGKPGGFQPRLSLSCFRGGSKLELIPQIAGEFTHRPFGINSVLAESDALSFQPVPTVIDKEYNEHGGLDWFLILKKKPSTNKLQFGYDAASLIPFFQPELTSIEVAEGNRRPDWVTNSIAWYHPTKGGIVSTDDVAKGITTGKAVHQYRPRVVAADNSWTWANLELASGNLVRIVIDQVWLNTKPYPMTLSPKGDTFGWTGVGGTTLFANTDYIRGSLAASATAGVCSKMSLYGSTGVGVHPAYVLGYYKDSDRSRQGKTISTHFPESTTGWNDQNIESGGVVDVINYYVVHRCDGLDVRHDNASTSAYHGVVGWADALNDPWNETAWAAHRFSLYATFTGASVVRPSNVAARVMAAGR
ncbi:MAG: hypothetical protein PHQ43_08555 [Dehalococcoidales bacterium]|nr:hypothetical protein [Dehalococcoidales bacterium]